MFFGGSASADYTITVNHPANFSFYRLRGNLPATGFSSMHVTELPSRPLSLNYEPVQLSLQIPALNVEIELVTVPLTDDIWDN